MKNPRRSDKIDKILADSARRESAGFTVVATGGYGRRDLAPFSDIDLLFLAENPKEARQAEKFATRLWDLKIKPSYSIRTVAEVENFMAEDLSFLTSLLDMRLVYGERKKFMVLQKILKNYQDRYSAVQFAAAKQAEQTRRHLQQEATSPLQPDIKNGKGGLRDIQTARWMEIYEGIKNGKSRKFSSHMRFLTDVRHHLHTLCQKGEDRLLFDYQPEIALRMDYDDPLPHVRAERFMKKLLTVMMEVAAGLSLEVPLEVKDMPALTEILFGRRENPAIRLHHLNAARKIHDLIPEFSNIFAHMQYDLYHFYTVDVHTIKAIDTLYDIETRHHEQDAPQAADVFLRIHSRRALYVAMLFHDMGKGLGGDHAIHGGKIAARYTKSFGLTPSESADVEWLVENHLLMTMTAFKRDLEDTRTLQDFCATVGTVDRLDMLYVMTIADIMAVGPGRWNQWKSGLLSALYNKSLELMIGTPLPVMCNNLDTPKSPVRVTAHANHDYTEVEIYVSDARGLFSLLSGAMAAAGASIVSARIHTSRDGMARDIFHVQTAAGHVYENAAYLQKIIKAALQEKLDVAAEISARQKMAPRRGRLIRVETRVTIDNNASDEATMIEVQARDRVGLLHDITQVLAVQGLQVTAAKVTTFGARAIDVFYVRDGFGLKILHPDKIKEIEDQLLSII